MKTSNCILILCLCLVAAYALPSLIDTQVHKDIRCLCHAVSGCYFLTNCAKYSVNYEYWQKAGSPVLSVDQIPDQKAYRACILNNNCVLNTINNYVQAQGEMDCNCDGDFNAEDMLAIHFGACQNMSLIPELARRQWRYNNCAKEKMDMPTGSCIPDAV
ncbi:PREDICTED: uncharacterized protein LOC108569559 [Nicrophorus vespilloides]|uniref:lysozyme n=1 Tax=Nicrophorus vespilloides TaxID=110193 RepID=A0ABM1NII6_NICVS|nr:PREDICTED: uncharacterized protein LOC108569559 [Nicrophorus vespilloides]